MSSSIATNVSALSAQRHANSTESGVQRTIQRLSSGLRINSARDDAAGLAISERMTSAIRGIGQTKRGVNDSISLLQVADGVMHNITEKLQRLRELSVQAANAGNSASDKAALQREAEQLLQGITQEANQAQFNGDALFSNGTSSIGGDTNKRLLIDKLKLGWFGEAERLIETYYGLKGDGAALTIDLDTFTDGGANVLAYVSGNVTGDGTWANLGMYFDMADFSPPTENWSDRVIAHELTHAVMARTLNMPGLPQWFVEGTAELIHGADDRLAGAIAGSSVAAVVGIVGGGGFSYESAYAASRYLHDRLKTLGVEGGIKGLMQHLDQTGATLDAALNTVTGGTYANTAAFVADFAANGVNFINTQMDLTNADTGAIGGFDADGGAVRTAASVIPDPSAGTGGTVLDGFDERFPTIGGTTETKQYVLQVGENIGDTMSVGLAAMNASALGLNGFDLQGLAGFNLLHVDEAIEFVSKQRANVGASLSRLESIGSTLDARSESTIASRSRIQDADYAVETAELTKTMILRQSATSMIAQANAQPRVVLALLRR